MACSTQHWIKVKEEGRKLNIQGNNFPTFPCAMCSLRRRISLHTDRFMTVFVFAMFGLSNCFVLAYNTKLKISVK